MAGRRQREKLNLEDVVVQKEDDRISKRLALARKRCKNYAKDINLRYTRLQGYTWVYPDINLAYCVTPKVGCTFWKRVFRYITHDYAGATVARPADIDRMHVHYDRVRNIRIYPLDNPLIRKFISRRQFNAFMFSRDPYARLWSAYVDKFFLPDFWQSNGVWIVSNFRANATRKQLVCGNDVTFEEFIKYVIHSLSTDQILNEHFNPIYRQCSPCHIKFKVLGKLETFQNDAQYIFKKFKLNDLSEKVSYSISVVDEVTMLIKYNFDLVDLGRQSKRICYDRTAVAEKLWKSFQFNGYISKDIPFPINSVQNIGNSSHIAKVFQDKVVETIQEQNVTADELKKQRRESLIKAYKHLPVLDLKSIPIVFQPDFELFDYDKYPKDIF